MGRAGTRFVTGEVATTSKEARIQATLRVGIRARRKASQSRIG
jgi:hypothetical protein